MIIELLAYFVWILMVVGMVAMILRLLHLDRPRPVRIPVSRQETRR